MTDEYKNLESELASLRPRDLSPESRRRIALVLSDEPQTPWQIRPRRIFLYAALAAACLLISLFIWRAQIPTPAKPTIARQPAAQPFATIATYRQALAKPDTLDALLDKQSAICLKSNPATKPLRAGLGAYAGWMN